MFEAFLKDKSASRNIIVLCVVLGIVLLLGSFWNFKSYQKKSVNNINLANTYKSNYDWFSNFDFNKAEIISKSILRPCTADMVDKVRENQIVMLKKSGLNVDNIKNSNRLEKNKEVNINYYKTSLEVSGTWEDFSKAMNHFEKEHFVIITGADITEKNNMVHCRLEYNVYFI